MCHFISFKCLNVFRSFTFRTKTVLNLYLYLSLSEEPVCLAVNGLVVKLTSLLVSHFECLRWVVFKRLFCSSLWSSLETESSLNVELHFNNTFKKTLICNITNTQRRSYEGTPPTLSSVQQSTLKSDKLRFWVCGGKTNDIRDKSMIVWYQN